MTKTTFFNFLVIFIFFLCACKNRTSVLIGKWSAYQDCPNTVFTFYGNGKIHGEHCDEKGELSWKSDGKYAFKANSIYAEMDTSKFEFTLKAEKDTMKLILRRFSQDFIFYKRK